MHLEKSSFCFSPETIELPGLDALFKLPSGTAFRYDGAVPDLARHIVRAHMDSRELDGIVRGSRRSLFYLLDSVFDAFEASVQRSLVYSRWPDIDNCLGVCVHHKNPESGRSVFVIAKKKGLTPSESVFTDGHESGEFLRNLGCQDFMQSLLDMAGIKADVRQYSGEDFADLGGVLAILKAKRTNSCPISIPEFKSPRPALEAFRGQLE